MDKEKIIKHESKEKKDIPVHIKISKSCSDWLNQNNYSPTGLFMEACRYLGYKGE